MVSVQTATKAANEARKGYLCVLIWMLLLELFHFTGLNGFERAERDK